MTEKRTWEELTADEKIEVLRYYLTKHHETLSKMSKLMMEVSEQLKNSGEAQIRNWDKIIRLLGRRPRRWWRRE